MMKSKLIRWMFKSALKCTMNRHQHQQQPDTVPKAPDKAEREERYALRRNVAKPDRLGFGTALKQSTKKRLKTPRKRK